MHEPLQREGIAAALKVVKFLFLGMLYEKNIKPSREITSNILASI